MYVSQETPEQTHDRLIRVMFQADLYQLDGDFAFFEYPAIAFPSNEVIDALAFVRDSDVWSVLRPATSSSRERFAVFSFHFAEGLDNSGFVGWLATLLKRELGAGVLVICGQNGSRGGIFDYWGIPVELRTQAFELLSRLRS
jgi:hypothetical protein